jgi:hypothetical protein
MQRVVSKGVTGKATRQAGFSAVSKKKKKKRKKERSKLGKVAYRNEFPGAPPGDPLLPCRSSPQWWGTLSYQYPANIPPTTTTTGHLSPLRIASDHLSWAFDALFFSFLHISVGSVSVPSAFAVPVPWAARQHGLLHHRHPARQYVAFC